MFVHKGPAHPRWKRFVGLALLVVGAARGASELTHEQLLARIRKNMTETLSRLPNYTCGERVDRRIRYPFERPHEDSDLIRLEVAYLGGRELFAWPGSTSFGEKAITEFVVGDIGTGNFGILAKQVFSSDAAVFTWSREYSREGRQRVEFKFRVPLEKSEFRLHNQGAESFVAYRGSFSADANTYDVVDLEVEGQEIPSRLKILQAKDRIEYARSRFSDSDYLLPKASQTTLSDIKGAFSQTSAAFFDCHAYRADSTVAFGERRPEANIATVGPKALPPGILLTLRTTVPIERGVTAIGDTVSAVLTRQIDNPVIPRGALASLRIVRMQPHQIGNRDGLLIGFQLLSIAVAGEKYDASGSLEAAKEKNTDKWDRTGQVAFLRTGRIDAGIELTWRTTSSR